jgi:hypothetical protein
MALPDNASTSGTVTAFAGASGLLQTLLDFVCGTDVTGATTSGSGSGPYAATLTTPVGLGRTIINYTFSAVDYEAQDDGTGTITGTNISSASVNHSTGAFTVTFTGTPDANPTVDYLHGEPGQDWRLNFQRNSRSNESPFVSDEPFGSACFECILHNTGLSGAENVLVGFREWQYPANPAHGWDLSAYRSYSDGQDWWTELYNMGRSTYDATWDHWSYAPMIPLIDDTMYYWFYSNQQRITGTVKVSSNYEDFYVGFGERFGNPEDYPYPIFIRGSAMGQVDYADAVSSNHAYIPYSTTSNVMHQNCMPDNSWSVNWGTGSSAFLTFLQPYSSWSNTGALYITPGKKEALMTPICAVNVAGRNTLFQLDGVYHCAGIGLQSEDTIRASNGVLYRVFQNITDVNYYDFVCMAEDSFTTTSTSTTTSSSTTTTTA